MASCEAERILQFSRSIGTRAGSSSSGSVPQPAAAAGATR